MNDEIQTLAHSHLCYVNTIATTVKKKKKVKLVSCIIKQYLIIIK